MPRAKAGTTSRWFHCGPREWLILGTSRMTYIDPTTIKGYKLFNAAFSAATPEEILDFLQLYAFDHAISPGSRSNARTTNCLYSMAENPFGCTIGRPEMSEIQSKTSQAS